MYDDFPAKNTVYTPYLPKKVWFWPTLHTFHVLSGSYFTHVLPACAPPLAVFDAWLFISTQGEEGLCRISHAKRPR
jgi:hypothetical protein